MFPQESDMDYVEEFRRTPSIPKDLPEGEKVYCLYISYLNDLEPYKDKNKLN